LTATIRLATPEDAEEIARLHVHTSLTAYQPILGDDYSGDDLEERVDLWRRMLQGDHSLAWPPPEKTYVAILEDGEGGTIAGFCSVGASRDEDAAEAGEVYMLYVSPDRWRGGIGGLLFDAGVRYLTDRGFPELLLWVLEGNQPARSFYERHGWVTDGAVKPRTARPRYRRSATARSRQRARYYVSPAEAQPRA
jgi:GNAT superfamily N-acetyltransferase